MFTAAAAAAAAAPSNLSFPSSPRRPLHEHRLARPLVAELAVQLAGGRHHGAAGRLHPHAARLFGRTGAVKAGDKPFGLDAAAAAARMGA